MYLSIFNLCVACGDMSRGDIVSDVTVIKFDLGFRIRLTVFILLCTLLTFNFYVAQSDMRSDIWFIIIIIFLILSNFNFYVTRHMSLYRMSHWESVLTVLCWYAVSSKIKFWLADLFITILDVNLTKSDVVFGLSVS